MAVYSGESPWATCNKSDTLQLSMHVIMCLLHIKWAASMLCDFQMSTENFNANSFTAPQSTAGPANVSRAVWARTESTWF